LRKTKIYKIKMILIDDREPKEIFEEFNRLGIGCKKERLKVGDIFYDNDIVIERKEIKDFVASIFDKRLFEQVERMQKYKKRIIVIVGNLIELDLERVNVNVVLGTIASLLIKRNVNIVAVDDNKQYCKLIERIVSKWEDIKNGLV